MLLSWCRLCRPAASCSALPKTQCQRSARKPKEVAGTQVLTGQTGGHCPRGCERAGKQALWVTAEEVKHFKN